MQAELDGFAVELDIVGMQRKSYTQLVVRGRRQRAEPFAIAPDPSLYPCELPRCDDSKPFKAVTLWTANAKRVTTQLGPELVGRIHAFAPSRLRAAPDRVALTWEGICTDRRHLESAVDLAVDIAHTGGSGLYR